MLTPQPQRLKKLSPRHMDIIRRLIVGETPGEISLELGMSQSRLSILQADPLFNLKLSEMQDEMNERFIDSRVKAMDILEDAAVHAARIDVHASTGVVERIIPGEDGEPDRVEYENVPVALQMKSAWDILDRTGNKGVDRKIVAVASLADLIAEAYKRKHKDDPDVEKLSSNDTKALIDVTPEAEGHAKDKDNLIDEISEELEISDENLEYGDESDLLPVRVDGVHATG